MSGSAAQTAPVNAVGVGMSYAHWEARRNQQHQDKNTYAANINKVSMGQTHEPLMNTPAKR